MKVLITGGAGFIGSNVAKRFLKKGNQVVILDNLSRDSLLQTANVDWLRGLNSPNFKFLQADIRDYAVLDLLFQENDFDLVVHQAGQTAVTTSVKDPKYDFECNALGTLNLLESIRTNRRNPIILYASTNKVYGELKDVEVEEKETRYVYKNLSHGVSEGQQLDFHSPYGCSKGVADQYMHDYARIYGLRTVVFRQSCIYGYRQIGIEDQGWIAWFIIAANLNKDITIFGNGKQVRDVLFIDDLVDLYELAVKNIDKCAGQAFNTGGGVNNTLSLLELTKLLQKLMGNRLNYKFADWRPGDQKVYISDILKLKRALGWEPKIDPSEGVRRLYRWIREHMALFK